MIKLDKDGLQLRGAPIDIISEVGVIMETILSDALTDSEESYEVAYKMLEGNLKKAKEEAKNPTPPEEVEKIAQEVKTKLDKLLEDIQKMIEDKDEEEDADD